ERDCNADPWSLVVIRRAWRLRPQRQPPCDPVRKGVAVERGRYVPDPLDEDLVRLPTPVDVPQLPQPGSMWDQHREVEIVRIVRSARACDDCEPRRRRQ